MAVKILVVDDSATMRKIMEMTFAGENAEVITVDDGDAAIRKAAELRPNVVFADVSMSGTDGYDVARAIRANASLADTAVILLASQHSAFDEERGRAAGVDDHVLKPFDTQALIDKLQSVLSQPRAKAAGSPAAQAPAPRAPASAGGPAAPATSGMRAAPLGGAPASPTQRKQTVAFGSGPLAQGPSPIASPSGQPKAPPPAPPSAPSRPSRPVLELAEDAIVEPSKPSGEVPGRTVTQPMAAAGAPASPASTSPSSPQAAPSRPQAGTPQGRPGGATLSSHPTRPTAPSTTPTAPAGRTAAVAATTTNGQMAKRLSDLGLSKDQIEGVLALSRELVEQVVWEVVPDLAETLIKEEIRRLTSE